ncbi:uncharacterized protein N7503_006180 [Penicillium pulvis]|uniref:uncharacterized protein n=1 Tax=Penicillium pulvis TaxID=1562058 RepID=UPI00254661F1|nr:uncharacterized protein N7503_006180 [Penicillium pulvis]KAJ5798675.1 hypothetical protein N7503_006180 [Penicillium pulvis]
MSQSRGAYSQLRNESLKPSEDVHPRLLSTQAWLMHGTLLTFAIILLVSSLVIVSSSKSCAEMAWSPVIDAVEVTSTRYNVTFRVPSKYPSRFIGSPGVDAVDAEWEQFTKNPSQAFLDGRLGTLAVNRATVANLPLASDPEWINSIVRISHGDETRYMATLEMFHHIHCLNMLRKASYPDYFGEDKMEAQMMRGHLDHCAETLREVLMCNSGVGLIMFHWVEGLDEPYPDYNTFHQCRDYDAVLNWALDNSVPIEFPLTRKSEDYAMKKPPF